MKKNIIAIICGIVAAAIIVTGSILSFGKMSESESIGSDSALSIALNDAGVNRNEAKNTKSVFERENRRYIFDVEFYYDGTEYDYDIDASTGEILKREAEKLTPTEKQTAPTEKTTEKATEAAQGTTNADTLIGTDSAKKIALRHAGFSAGEVKFTKAKSDYENGKPVYEIEFVKGSTEYEYEIDAKSGKILSFEKEQKKRAQSAEATTARAETTDKYIGLESAKKIALRNAGLSGSDVKITKAKIDYDDGKAVYEIEFVKGSTEYEYEIDAKSGKIIDFDKETHNKTANKKHSKDDGDDDDDDDDNDDDDDD